MIANDMYLDTFGRHVPRILKRQIISKLANQYIEEHGRPVVQIVDVVKDVDGDATISRFHCTMLFVDISGFTVLSQRLKVDELKARINDYFELIVSIIVKYDGEIIKFAGDAIFVIFQTKINRTDEPNFLPGCKEVVDTAVACGREVLAKCGHYPVQLGKDANTDSTVASMELFESLEAGNAASTAAGRTGSSQKYAVPAAGAATTPSVTHLDVHCGVSMGVMAGIDVGAAGRFEYLIMGQPMSDVAIAEGDAAKGELVISPEVHDFLHRYTGPGSVGGHGSMSRQNSDGALSERKKPAAQVGGGSFFGLLRKGSKVLPAEAMDPEQPPAASPRPTAEGSGGSGGVFCKPLQPDLPSAQLSCGCCVTPAGYFRVNGDLSDPLIGPTRAATALGHVQGQTVASDIVRVFAPIKQKISSLCADTKAWAGATESERASVVENHFKRWMQACLVDDIATHVHEVSRLSYELRTLDERSGPLAAYLRSYECEEDLRGGVHDDTLGVTHTEGQALDSLVTPSELRNVIVMFVNIKMEGSTVFIDPTPPPAAQRLKTCAIDDFHFLARSQAELDADIILRDKFQKCFAVMAETFHEKGGQVRQFIVDDKGTVCIGTFGLRGAVNYDNAAAAVETAELILQGLQKLGIGASIGLTSGQAYCGLVGSTLRHEYAVMGPSTNLSARLMCRAAIGEAICDAETRNRDRVHPFTTLAAVQAKGYAQLVPTFRPNLNAFAEVISNPEAPDLTVDAKGNKSVKANLVKKRAFIGTDMAKLRDYTAAHKLHGRDSHIRRVVDLLLPTDQGERLSAELKAAMENGTLSSPAQPGADAVTFDVTKPTRLVGVVGAHGIGKTCLLDFFQDQLSRLSESRGYNLQVFRHRVGYINSSSPFSAWMCMIIHEMFFVAQWWFANKADEETRKNTVVTFNEIGKGLGYICSQLDPELQELVPLLCDIGLHPPLPDTATTAPLKGTQRLYRTADLLAGIIGQFPKITGKLAFIIMDDIQNNDSVSQYLLRKVWTELSGVALLCSYRPKAAKSTFNTGASTPSSVSTRSTRASSHSSADLRDFLDIPIVEFLNFMDESDVFRRVELFTLDKPAVRALVSDIFELYMIRDVDDVVFDKLYEFGAGNPLYTTELAKGIAQKRAILLDTSASIPSLTKLLTEMRTVRVEEVVYYRFDQLDHDWQVVLKLASVASSNGAPFNVAMLEQMLKEDAYFRKQVSSDFDLPAVLNAMLATNEFIYLKNMSPWVPIVDRGNAYQEFDAETLGKLFMSWSIAMEQRAVYELLLDEQKEALHRIMVTYLSQAHPEATSHDLSELGHHHDRARSFGQAMRCYYDAGMQLHGKGDHHDALKLFSSAQRMLSKLRHLAGISDEMQGWRACTPEKVQKVFGDDQDLARVATSAILRLAQSLLIYTQQTPGADDEVLQLARRNAITFFEQAQLMIKLAREAGAVTFAEMNALFWECYGAGTVQAPDGAQSFSGEEGLAAMAAALKALKAATPLIVEEEGDADDQTVQQ